jgi:hypothetical protein
MRDEIRFRLCRQISGSYFVAHPNRAFYHCHLAEISLQLIS